MSVLTRPVLVLNKSWLPVNCVSVARAVALLCNEAAKVVNVDDYQTLTWSDWTKLTPSDDEICINAISFKLKVPEVITLTAYNKQPKMGVTLSRRNIFRRDHFICQYCGNQPKNDELTIDHIMPRSAGGITSWTNCVLSCLECNKKKADRTPKAAGMKLRKEPTKPKWKPVYHDRVIKLDSWSKFVSDMYWNVELDS